MIGGGTGDTALADNHTFISTDTGESGDTIREHNRVRVGLLKGLAALLMGLPVLLKRLPVLLKRLSVLLKLLSSEEDRIGLTPTVLWMVHHQTLLKYSFKILRVWLKMLLETLLKSLLWVVPREMLPHQIRPQASHPTLLLDQIDREMPMVC